MVQGRDQGCMTHEIKLAVPLDIGQYMNYSFRDAVSEVLRHFEILPLFMPTREPSLPEKGCYDVT